MKKLKKLLFRKPRKRAALYKVNYHENWMLPPAALFTGTFIVLYGGPVGFGQAFFMPGFHKAAVPSVLAAWFVMWGIVKVAYILDDVHPWAIAWYRGPLVRLALQLFFGIAMPGFFIFGVFALYFLVRGRADLIPRYALEDFPFVLVMLLGYSVILWIYYRVRTREIMEKFRAWRYAHGKSEEEMERKWAEGTAPSETFLDRMRTEAALFEPGGKEEEKGTWALLFTNERRIQLHSVDELERMLAGPDFCLIYRATLVNRAAIARVNDANGKAEVVLLDSLGGRVLEVSRRHRSAFLKWWREGE